MDCICSGEILFKYGCVCGAFNRESDAETLDFIIMEDGAVIPLK